MAVVAGFSLSVGAAAGGAVCSGESAAPVSPPKPVTVPKPIQAGGGAGDNKVQELVIGAVLPMEGRLGMYGESVLLGLVTRIEEWNHANAGKGRHVRLLIRDSHSDPDRAVEYVREFADSTDPVVPVIVGPILSRAVRESERVALAKKRVLVTPLGTTFEPEPGAVWTFRMAPSGWAQARALARFMVHTIGRRRAAILVDPRFETSTAYADNFAEAVEVEGGEVVAREKFTPSIGANSLPVSPNRQETQAGTNQTDAENQTDADNLEHNLEDYRAALRKIAAAKPDTLFIPCYAVDITDIIQAVAEFPELNDVRMCGPDLWDNQLVFDASGQRLIGSFFTSVLQSSRTRYQPYQRFLASMLEAGVEFPDAQITCSYEAATMILLAIERSETYDSESIRQALLAMHNEELATGVTSVTKDGMVEKPIVIRVIRNRDGWPTPIYQESISNIQPLPSQEEK